MKDLIALAGDLVSERKRLSESLRRLEGVFLRGEVAAEMFRILGAETSEGVLGELDGMAKSLDRVGALTKTLVHKVNHDRLMTCEPLLADAVLTIEAVASSLERPVAVDCKSNEVRIDREILEKFRPVFLEMLETMVEYCVESSKERQARKKRPKAYFQIDVKPLEGGYRLMVLCDGNGILPPLGSDHGVKLAEIGVRANFEGKPGQWSAWRYHIPSGLGAFHCVPVRASERRLCIPAWAVVSSAKIDRNTLVPAEIWGISDKITRFAADTDAESLTGMTLMELAAGTHTTHFVFEEVHGPVEGFIKPLGEYFNGNGRFLGVVVGEDDGPGERSLAPRAVGKETRMGRDELTLVLNPAYLVYGGGPEELLASERTATRKVAGGEAETGPVERVADTGAVKKEKYAP